MAVVNSMDTIVDTVGGGPWVYLRGLVMQCSSHQEPSTSFSSKLMTLGKHQRRAGLCDDSDQQWPGHTVYPVYTPVTADQGQAGMTPPHGHVSPLSPRATCPEITRVTM